MASLETSEGRLRFFDLDRFGLVVQVAGQSVQAIFEAGYAEAGGMEGTSPALTCRSEDVSGAQRGADVVVPDVGSFKVITVGHDGTGIAYIDLEEV